MRITSLSQMPSEAVTRFRAKFTSGREDECWLWLGTMHHTGYGVMQITIDGIRKQYSSHQLAHSEIGTSGLARAIKPPIGLDFYGDRKRRRRRST